MFTGARTAGGMLQGDEMVDCSCAKGYPVIAVLRSHEDGACLAGHCCSHCGSQLFESELKPGEKLIATGDIASGDGRHVIPKGRVLRITGFADLDETSTGLLFCGLLAAGAFPAAGFSSAWDIGRLLGNDDPPAGAPPAG